MGNPAWGFCRGFVTSRKHTPASALPSWQVAQLPCHPVLTVTCARPSLQLLPWQGSAFLLPHHGDFLEALVRN